MKWVVIALVLMLASLQYKLWFQDGGIKQTLHLQQQIDKQKTTNKTIAAQNQQLTADIKDLKQGQESIEEKARYDLGMVKPNEEYYQIVNVNKSTQESHS